MRTRIQHAWRTRREDIVLFLSRLLRFPRLSFNASRNPSKLKLNKQIPLICSAWSFRDNRCFFFQVALASLEHGHQQIIGWERTHEHMYEQRTQGKCIQVHICLSCSPCSPDVNRFTSCARCSAGWQNKYSEFHHLPLKLYYKFIESIKLRYLSK